jgi:hypothetical protein
MLIQQSNNKVVISLLSQETEELPSKGDVYLEIEITSNGYSGKNDLWVLYADFKEFCNALIVLNEKRQGEAVLFGMSPNELEIRIHSVSSLGHIAISGYTGYEMIGENSSFLHQVKFGFEFDPSQLEKIVNSKWVRDNAAIQLRNYNYKSSGAI